MLRMMKNRSSVQWIVITDSPSRIPWIFLDDDDDGHWISWTTTTRHFYFKDLTLSADSTLQRWTMRFSFILWFTRAKWALVQAKPHCVASSSRRCYESQVTQYLWCYTAWIANGLKWGANTPSRHSIFHFIRSSQIIFQEAVIQSKYKVVPRPQSDLFLSATEWQSYNPDSPPFVGHKSFNDEAVLAAAASVGQPIIVNHNWCVSIFCLAHTVILRGCKLTFQRFRKL